MRTADHSVAKVTHRPTDHRILSETAKGDKLFPDPCMVPALHRGHEGSHSWGRFESSVGVQLQRPQPTSEYIGEPDRHLLFDHVAHHCHAVWQSGVDSTRIPFLVLT